MVQSLRKVWLLLAIVPLAACASQPAPPADEDHLVFLDETWVSTAMTRLAWPLSHRRAVACACAAWSLQKTLWSTNQSDWHDNETYYDRD